MINMLAFISQVYAATEHAATGQSQFTFAGFIPLILIFVVFYFLLIRPQQKKMKAHAKMLEDIRRGDKVVTSSGIIGVIDCVDTTDGIFSIEIASGVKISIMKNSVSEVLSKNSSSSDSVAKN